MLNEWLDPQTGGDSDDPVTGAPGKRTVPACSGKTLDACTASVSGADLNVAVRTRSEFDFRYGFGIVTTNKPAAGHRVPKGSGRASWSHPADPVVVAQGTIRSTTPEPGDPVHSFEDLVVTEIQTDAEKDEREQRCDDRPRQQVLTPSMGLLDKLRYVPVQPAHMHGQPNPMPTSDSGPALLYYGHAWDPGGGVWEGFGYFKIVQKHGWDEVVAGRTSNALRFGLPRKRTDSRTIYLGTERRRVAGLLCAQSVVVERESIEPGRPVPEVITSYGLLLPTG